MAIMIAFVQDRLDERRARRRAGERARRKYAALRRAWLRRNRKFWLLAVVVAIALWIGFLFMLRAIPGEQGLLGAFFGGALFGILLAFRHTTPVSIAAWQEGALGEESTARQLRALQKEGWVVLHDLANGSANFDHVVIGPNGVFCLNSKWSGYRLEADANGRMVGRHNDDQDIYQDVSGKIRRAKAEAAMLSERIATRCGTKVWVQPVIVWWGTVENGGRLIDNVGVVQGEYLADRLRAQKGRPVPQFDHVVASLTPGRHRRRRASAKKAG